MRYPAYPEYKYSGVEWLGDVPKGWGVLKLKRIVATPITDGPHETPQLFDEGIPFVSAEAVSSGKVDFSKIRGFISEDDYERFSKKYIPQVHDIFMVKSGATTGVTALVMDDIKFTIWSPLAVIRCDKKSSPLFILNFMRSKNFLDAIALNWSYGTQQNIGMNVIENLYVALPSVEEQQSIANFLDTKTSLIDNLIAKMERQIELLKEKRIAIIDKAVTKGLNSDAPVKDSGIEWLGEVPEHWCIKRLRFACTLNPSKAEVSNLSKEMEVSFLPMDKISENGELLLDETRAINDVYQGFTYFSNGDVVMAKITPCFENGKGAICQNLVNGIGFGTTELHVFRCGHQMISKFIFYITKSYRFRVMGEAFMQGSAGQKRVTDWFLRDFIITIPPTDEQKKIIAHIDQKLDEIDNVNSKLQSQIEKLREYRQSLISAAVTGKIDVRETVNAS